MEYRIYIDGKDYTSKVVLPFTIQETVDESLDQASLRLAQLEQSEPFKPLTAVAFDILGNDNTGFKYYYFFVASDTVTETLGTNKYEHQLTLIEQTKWLERFTGITKCVTNPLVHDYNENPLYANATIMEYNPTTGGIFKTVRAEVESFKTPVKPEQIIYPSGSALNEEIRDYLSNKGNITDNDCTIQVFANDVLIYERSGYEAVEFFWSIDHKAGNIYKIIYDYKLANWVRFTVNVSCLPEKYKHEDYTITRVVNELLETVETITDKQTPRFTFDSIQASKYENVKAPEFNLNGTLFECLKQIGDYIQGIPRLVSGNIIKFDEAVTDTEFKLKDNYIAQSRAFDIEQFATLLDSNVDNMVNTDAVEQGSLIEPSNNTYKTLRTDIATVQLKDENAFIETSQAIEQIVKVECGYLYDDTYVGDITQYVYSSTEYNGLLSSTEDAYPLSKAYAIYYGQGQKNIYGLNFKLPNAIHPIFEDYSIINIINKVTGGNYKSQDIMKLQFRVTYIPKLNLRVRQHKTNINELGKPSALNFNQSAQKVSAQNYANAIRGALAKLGNPERTLSYIFTSYTQLPQCGWQCKDDYYISVVSTEFYGSFYKCNISLSKNYNRKDKYVSLNNNIRFYEVSEQQAVDRQVYYEDACIIGNSTTEYIHPETHPRITPKALEEIASSFENQVANKITAVNSKTYDKDKEIIAQSLMPVTSLGIGKSLLMHWEYLDNYTSGTAVTEESGSRLQKQQPYADIYGEIKYLGFDLGKIDFDAKNSITTAPYDYERSVKIGDNLPKPIDMFITGKDGQPYFSTDRYPYPYGTEIIDSNLIVLNKDSREIISFNYQINFFTNDNIIIGNELAKSSPFATMKDADYKLYVWYSWQTNKRVIPNFADELDLSQATEIGKVTATVSDYGRCEIKIENVSSEVLMANNPLGTDSGFIIGWAMVNNGKLLFGKNLTNENAVWPSKDLVMPYLTFKHII